MRATRPAPLPARLLLALSCLFAASCGGERSARAAEEAEAARAVVRAASPEQFAELLRAHYSAERACLEKRFPATVTLTPGDSSRRARMTDEEYARPYELLREVGLVTREEVRPGERDWRLPGKAHVDSGGVHRVVRYVLSERARRDAERSDAGQGERLCYGRRRLLAVDSLDAREPSPSWSVADGVRYSHGVVFVGHVVAFDSVAPWAHEVAQRDSLDDLEMEQPAQLDGPHHRWAEFWVRNGDWIYAGIRTTTPR